MTRRDDHEPPSPAHVAVDADGVATITIHGAKSIHIVGSPAIGAIRAAIERLRDDPAVRVLVLRGAGEAAFVGGADIREMAALTTDTARDFIDGLRALCEAARLFPLPVIARLSGWCLGGGLELAMACDLRLAAAGATLGMPEVRFGIPSVIHAALLPRLVGQSAAAWMLLTGEAIDAETAFAWGLVHRVCPAEALDAEVARTARLLAGLGSDVLRRQKRLLREWQELPLEAAIARSVDDFAAAFGTGEPQRFMREFLARRR